MPVATDASKQNLKRGKGPLAVRAALALLGQGPGWARPQGGNRSLGNLAVQAGTGPAWFS